MRWHRIKWRKRWLSIISWYWYVHFASCFYINIYCIMGCHYTLYLNVYGYSLLFYKVYHEEGECRQLEFWLEKEQTLETYSAQLQKSWNSTKQLFGINKNFWAKEIHQGAHTLSRKHAPPIGRAPYLLGPLVGLRCPSSAIWELLPWKKSWASLRDETPPPRGGTLAEPV